MSRTTKRSQKSHRGSAGASPLHEIIMSLEPTTWTVLKMLGVREEYLSDMSPLEMLRLKALGATIEHTALFAKSLISDYQQRQASIWSDQFGTLLANRLGKTTTCGSSSSTPQSIDRTTLAPTQYEMRQTCFQPPLKPWEVMKAMGLENPDSILSISPNRLRSKSRRGSSQTSCPPMG